MNYNYEDIIKDLNDGKIESILFSITEVSISGGRFMVAVVIPVKKQTR